MGSKRQAMLAAPRPARGTAFSMRWLAGGVGDLSADAETLRREGPQDALANALEATARRFQAQASRRREDGESPAPGTARQGRHARLAKALALRPLRKRHARCQRTPGHVARDSRGAGSEGNPACLARARGQTEPSRRTGLRSGPGGLGARHGAGRHRRPRMELIAAHAGMLVRAPNDHAAHLAGDRSHQKRGSRRGPGIRRGLHVAEPLMRRKRTRHAPPSRAVRAPAARATRSPGSGWADPRLFLWPANAATGQPRGPGRQRSGQRRARQLVR